MTYRPRQVVLRQGEEGQHALLLLSGHVKVVVATEFGADVLLAVRGTGDLCGEMAVLEHRHRSASVLAGGPVQARLITAAQFVGFLERTPEAALAVARLVSERLRWANIRRAEFVACPAPIRVARVLLDINSRRLSDGVPLSRSEIASLAGASLGATEKALRTMREQELVDRGYRRTVVTNLIGLRRFAELAAENPYQYGVSDRKPAHSEIG